MKSEIDEEWVKFYMAFADSLLPYKNNRQKLLAILKEVHKRLDMNYPFMDDGSEIEDICPFTVMGCFNKMISPEHRIGLMHELSEELAISVPVPTQIGEIPIVNNLDAWFFRFREHRDPADIPNLWELFEAALCYADDSTEGNKARFIINYNKAISQPCTGWKLTKGLFWMRPLFYLNLDQKSQKYLLSGEVTDEINNLTKMNKVPDANIYIELITICKRICDDTESPFHSFPELVVKAADTMSQEENSKFSRWIVPLIMALRELGGSATPKEVREKIKEELKLSEEILSEVSGKTKLNKFTDQVYWARLYLVYSGIISNEKRGIWQLTEKGMTIELTPQLIEEIVKEGRKKSVKKDDEVEDIDATESEDEREESEIEVAFEYDTYSEADFLEEIFMSKEGYEALTALLEKKKNIILQGAPGVGKTFIAKKLAYSIMGNKNSQHIRMVQFHQSYSYEDFIMGYRPTKQGFELKAGPFYEFCKIAEKDSLGKYYFIIDEINRGNMSKIFGELLMLIETDKRDQHLELLYSDENIPRNFSVPSNLYIIGMMNTADRSLAMIDYALRRRFAFYTINPAFDSEGFEKVIRLADNDKFNRLIGVIKQLNKEICQDDALGEGFMIGHSYFCTDTKAEDSWLRAVVEYEVIPLIKEYWFDDNEKVEKWSRELRGVVND